MTLPTNDLKLAIRGLFRSPLFSIVAILSLALGIGANTAIFTLIDQILLRKLPVKNPDELVMLYQSGPHAGSNMGSRMHSYPIYQEYQQRAEPLAEVLARRLADASVAVDNQTERIDIEMVSGNFFSMLGVTPAAGRVFNSQEDDQTYSGHPVVVLSYDYWTRRFNNDQAAIGKKILVNNYPMTIVGVSARGFAGIDPARSPQMRVPILMKPVIVPEWEWVRMSDERTRWVQVFARLKPGFTPETAQGPLQGLFTQIRQHEMTLPGAKNWNAFLRERFMQGRLNVEKADVGYSPLRNDFSTALMVLMAMVGLVLLIACANVANLLIARGFMRQREIAVRLSLGATRGQLVRQLLTESVLLSLIGGAIGIGLSVALTQGLIALIPQQQPLLIQPTPDLRILSFTFGLTLFTGIVFGLLPALKASNPDQWATLKDTVGGIAGTGGSLFLRKGLVAAQVALSFLLLFGAGLFVRSLQNLQTTDTGLQMDNLVTFRLSPALSGYDNPRTVNLYNELLERLRSTPGIVSASHASVALLAGDEWDSTTSVEGHQAKDGEDMQAFMNALSPGYFDTMGIKLLDGRDFRASDITQDNPKIAIVNQKFAQHFFKDKSAVGRRLGRGLGPETKLDIEIIGVVQDSLYEGPREGVRRQVFWPGNGGSATFYVRTTEPSSSAFNVIRSEVKRLDAGMPVYDVKTVQGQLDETLLTDRLIALLSAGFGLLATALASIGLYGVMAFIVARRRKEIGLRLALGAEPSGVLWIVMREVLILLTIGLAVGVPSAIGLGRYVSSQLYGIQPNDPWMATGTVLLLTVVSAAAGFIPATRASRIDPILALRYE
jgi:predicted permease